MRRTWAGLLVGGAALAVAAAAWVMRAQPLATVPDTPPPVTQATPARNPTVFAGDGAPALPPVDPVPPLAAPAPTPPSPSLPRQASEPPAAAPVTAAPRPDARVAPRPAPSPAATLASAPTRPSALEGAPGSLSQCRAPAAPSPLSGSAAPSEAQLASFATAVERFDTQSAQYRRCLDAVFNDRNQPEDARRAALTAANANALQAGQLWDAYEAATQRYRNEQAEAAREAEALDAVSRPAAP